MYFGPGGGAKEYRAFLAGNHGRTPQCIRKGVAGEICHNFRFVPYDVQKCLDGCARPQASVPLGAFGWLQGQHALPGAVGH
jgi:hypothetical protein